MFKFKLFRPLCPSQQQLILFFILLVLAGTVDVQARKGYGDRYRDRNRDRDRDSTADRTSVEAESQPPLTQHEPEPVSEPEPEPDVSGSSPTAGQGQVGSSGGSREVRTLSKYDKYESDNKYSPSASASIYPPSASASATSAHQQTLNYYSAYGYPSLSSSSSNNVNIHAHTNPYNYNRHGNDQVPYYSSYSPYAAYSNVEPYWTERTGKDFSTRIADNDNIPMESSHNHYAYESTGPGQSHEQVEMHAMASSHGHGHGHGGGGGGGHGGGGGGWGWKGGSQGGGNNLDTSALGVLGLIGLLSILQRVLLMISTTTTTTTPVGRKKRDIIRDGADEVDIEGGKTDEDGIHMAERISLMVLPSLNVIAHAREGRVPLECSHREICMTNQLLVQQLGTQGRSVGSIISSAVTKLLKETDKTGAIGKNLLKASLAGRSGDDCHVMYPVCTALEKEGAYSLPLLVPPHHLTHLVPIKSQTHNQNPPFSPSPSSHKKHFRKRKKTVKKVASSVEKTKTNL